MRASKTTNWAMTPPIGASDERRAPLRCPAVQSAGAARADPPGRDRLRLRPGGLLLFQMARAGRAAGDRRLVLPVRAGGFQTREKHMIGSLIVASAGWVTASFLLGFILGVGGYIRNSRK
jgi:hypothetical protein